MNSRAELVEEDEEEEVNIGRQCNVFIFAQQKPPAALVPASLVGVGSCCSQSCCDSTIRAFNEEFCSNRTLFHGSSSIGSRYKRRWRRGRYEKRKPVEQITADIRRPGLVRPRALAALPRNLSIRRCRELKLLKETISHGSLNMVLLCCLLVLPLLSLSLPTYIRGQTLPTRKSQEGYSQVFRSSIFTGSTNSSAFAQQARPKRATATQQISSGPEIRQGREMVLAQTKHGLFRGRVLTSSESRVDNSDENDVVAFLGIRYASAPVKRLRFMPPTAYHYAQNQIHNMQHFGPICRQRWPIDLSQYSLAGQLSATLKDYQQSSIEAGRMRPDSLLKMSSPSKGLLDFDNMDSEVMQMRLLRKLIPHESYNYLRPLFEKLMAREQSEDCLNLNIYVPAKALVATLQNNSSEGQQLPVLVIVHGESFDYGAGSTIDGSQLAKHNQLIIITFNYRLNILGFPPKLAGASRGNLGLMDQVAVLHWIKDNVSSFGGSPTNITLMGTKRGAIFVNLLMLSPLAKGLFHRAIMEDGSALTPIVANHIISPSSGSAHGQQPQSTPLASSAGSSSHSPGGYNSLASQHVHLLAKLCDCPVYQPRVAGTKLAPTKHSNATGGSINSATSINQQQQLSSAGAHLDESRANALTFECLRHKPVEQIMQLVPIDLLQHNKVAGDRLVIASRWLKLASNVQVPDEQSATDLKTDTSNQQQPQQQPMDEELVPVDGRMISRLALAAARDQLDSDLEAATNGQVVASFGRGNTYDHVAGNQRPEGVSETTSSSSPSMTELFSAVYGPSSSSSIRPLFGPVVDGTIVPEEDIATSMLRSGSSFAQRDLLIGLSQPIISSSSHSNGMGEDNVTREQLGGARLFELGPEHLMADRVTAQLEQVGLSNEQAVELVNVFVRSFYRYHNQEIVNSIINHYLSGGNGRAASSQRRVKPLARHNAAQSTGQRHKIPEETTRESKLSQQQLLVLDSLLEAFQDALVNVPVLKTSLIHATRQLDSLVDAFIGHQFEKWKSQQQQITPSASILSPNVRILSSGSEDRNHQPFSHEGILNDFSSFARTLFSDPNWPLKLHSSSRAAVQQPKATYLYQIDSSLVFREFRRLILGIEAKTSFGWKSLRQILEKALDSMLDQRPNFSLECSLRSDGPRTEITDAGAQLAETISRWICSELGKFLGSFVISGNVNAKRMIDGRSEEYINDLGDRKLVNEERMSSYGAKCAGWRNANSVDHDSVQVTEAARVNERDSNDTCDQELQSIAFDYISNGIGGDQQYNSKWTVFNLFSQQVATLPNAGNLLRMSQAFEGESAAGYDQKSSFSARSAFWANFVPALNCSKTQPVIPTSLLSNPLIGIGANSSLLNLNLQFSCQQGAKTVYSLVEILATNIGQQLQLKVDQWKSMNNGALQQNHHSLRNANMSQSNGSPDNLDQQDPLSDQNRPITQNDLRSPTTNSLETQKSDHQTKGSDGLRTRYLVFTLIVGSLLVSITLASGACMVMKKRKQADNCNNKRIESNHELTGNGAQIMQQQQAINLPNDDSTVSNHHSQIAATEMFCEAESLPRQTDQIIPIECNQVAPSEASIVELPVPVQQHYHSHTHQLLEQGNASNMINQICSQDNHNSYIYWGPSEPMSAATVSVCQSRLSLNGGADMGSNGTAILTTSPMEHLSTCGSDQEPIMMPILTNGLAFSQQQQRIPSTSSLAQRHGCLTNTSGLHNNGLPNDSSSETQGHSSISSTKKRVKISDPLIRGRRNSRESDSNFRASDSGSQLVLNDPIYCPVHKDQVAQSSTRYVVNGDTYITSDNHNFWPGSQINLVDQSLLNSMQANNYDFVVPNSYNNTLEYRGKRNNSSSRQGNGI